jgi:hypothetical protein
MMGTLLMCVAWGAGIASLLLVADMIKTDLSMQRAERGGPNRGGRAER